MNLFFLKKLLATLLLATSVTALDYVTTHRSAAEMELTRMAVKLPVRRATVDLKKTPGKRHVLAGLASWYGEVLEGRRTASGTTFHKDELTACHPTLPFGTLVRVINLRNRKSVVVRITDRGLLFPHRVIDLSSAAAMKIGMLRSGIAPVRLEILPAVHG